MSKTNELKKLIQRLLKDICPNVYHELAIDDAMYPHIVYQLSTSTMLDLNREDFMLIIDVWDKGSSTSKVDELADQIEALFNNLNSPQSSILPTFFTQSNRTILDDDKKIRHRQITVVVQNYERMV